jgi:hypothetical protein
LASGDGDRVNFDIVETVNKDDVAKSVSDQLGEQFGRTPDITCPDDLKRDVRATTRCELTHQGTTYGFTVTVSSVDSGDVKYDFKVDEQRSSGVCAQQLGDRDVVVIG